MTRQKNSTATENEKQAIKELHAWFDKWAGTLIATQIRKALNARKRGRPDKTEEDIIKVVLTVALLEKCGMSLAAAKKEAANRYCLNLRSVQGYYKRASFLVHEFDDEWAASANVWDGIAYGCHLRKEELRKLMDELFSRKLIAE